MLTRRAFAKLSGVAAVAISVPFTTACPAWLQTIYADIKAYAPTILSAVTGVISILAGAGVLSVPISGIIAAVLVLISKAVGDLQVAVNTYQNAPSSQRSTLIGAITTALADAEANIQQFWNDLTIPDAALATTIENLLGVIVSTLQGYINSLPTPPTATKAMMARATLPKLINVPAKRRSMSQFKTDYNALLSPNYKMHSL